VVQDATCHAGELPWYSVCRYQLVGVQSLHNVVPTEVNGQICLRIRYHALLVVNLYMHAARIHCHDSQQIVEELQVCSPLCCTTLWEKHISLHAMATHSHNLWPPCRRRLQQANRLQDALDQAGANQHKQVQVASILE
jgi:hypothetical protein